MAHDFKNYPELTNNQMQYYYFASPHKQITEDFQANVIKVTDGDTIRVMTNFRDFDFPIRILNIAAPEIDERGGPSSKRWLTNQILGKNVTITIDFKNRVEKWGRLLGEVFNMGVSMGEMSVMLGHSVRWDERTSQNPFPKLENFL